MISSDVGWPDRRVQYLGKISYSLYLVHPLVGQRLPNLGYRLTGESPAWVLVWGALGFAAAVGASHLFWRWIEVPSIALSRTLGRGQQRQPGPIPEPMLTR